jgi:hypothetical protein
MDASSAELHAQIGRVLLKSWDPLDVAGRPEGDAERARYIAGVVALLATGASDRQVAEHLVGLEAQRFGYRDSEPGMLRPTAKKLRLLYRRLAAEPGAV